MILEDTNVPGFKKDKKTGFVINNNLSDLRAYKQQRQSIHNRKRLEEKVTGLETELAEQKTLLLKILERLV